MKKKLKLRIETLRVERFEAQQPSPAARGTVHGFQTDVQDTCIWKYCFDTPGTQFLAATDCC
jgi:hypothetical protein